MSAPAWLNFVGPCTTQDVIRLEALRKEARRLGCSLRWQWTGNKWTGKSGIRMGQAQIVRNGVVLAHESFVHMFGRIRSHQQVVWMLDTLEHHLAEIKSLFTRGG